MSTRKNARYRQSKAASIDKVGPGVRSAMATVEDLGKITIFYADAMILDSEFCERSVSFCPAHREVNRSTRCGVTNRIVDEHEKQLSERIRVAECRQAIGPDRCVKFDLVGARHGRAKGDNLRKHITKVNRRLSE